jgi:hypothetical protein
MVSKGGDMRASRIVAASAFVLGSLGGVAFADDAKAPIVVKVLVTTRRPVPPSVDVARLIPRAPLPELRKSLVDPWGNTLDGEPF